MAHRLLGLALCAAIAVFSMAPLTWAANPTVQLNRVDIAGRQRMLSQYISLSLCLSAAEVNTEARREQAKAAISLFDGTLRVLQVGDPAYGLAAEKNTNILRSLAGVAETWFRLGPAYWEIANGLNDDLHLQDLVEYNVLLLEEMDAAVGQIAQVHAGEVTDYAASHTINLAGRQRMLSQKAAKEACFILLRLRPAEMLDTLADTIAEFELHLEGLKAGSSYLGVVPPTPEISAQLDIVEQAWGALKGSIERAARGTNDLRALDRRANVVLAEMDKAVKLYVAAYAAQ